MKILQENSGIFKPGPFIIIYFLFIQIEFINDSYLPKVCYGKYF